MSALRGYLARVLSPLLAASLSPTASAEIGLDPLSDTWAPPTRLNPALAAAVQGGGCTTPERIRINEVAFRAGPAGAHWIELVNEGEAGANLAGNVLAHAGGAVYVIPGALPTVPPNGFVVVFLDGQGPGSDDYDLSDGVAVLHSAGLANPLGVIDEAALYSSASFSPDTIRAFVAWGGLPTGIPANDAVAAGLWLEGDYVAPEDSGPGLDTTVDQDGSTGLFGEGDASDPAGWVVYTPARTTPGGPNLAPAPEFRSPPDGQSTSDRDVAFGWSTVAGATGYHLEVDDSADFSSPVIDVLVDDNVYIAEPPLADGQYFFRVSAQLASGPSASEVNTIEVFAPPPDREARVINTLPGFNPILQHKDTGMLCLEGCARFGNLRWDGRHAACDNRRRNCNRHDNMYCARASISMINRFHGGDLSQDRIAYEYYSPDEPGPDFDLRHGIGMYPGRLNRPAAAPATGKDIFEWAMGGAASNVQKTFGAPTFAQIQAAINAGHPILIGENTNAHAVVITGWAQQGAWRWFERTDPWTARKSWILYPASPFPRTITEWHVCNNPVNPRLQEAGVTADTDGDGLVDFDETNRFNTNPNAVDSDNDGVNDREEIASYVFRFPLNVRAGVVDIDRDGLRVERDFDSDNGGLRDGLEDRNADGAWQRPAETDVYNAADDGPNRLDFVFCVDVTGSMLDDIQAVRLSALNILNRINQTMPGWRVAIVVYRDFPILPFGNIGDFPFAVVTPFTGDINTAVAGINALPGLVGGGGDIPESVYFALARTIPGQAVGGWRGGATKRAIMVFGDAPPHDPEPFTGLRRADIVRMAQANRVGGGFRADDAESGAGAGSEAPIDFYNVVIGADAVALSSFEALSHATGGTLFDAAGDGQVVSTILSAIDEIDADPYADAGGPYNVVAGEAVTLDAGGSADDGCVVLYQWDFDGDGAFDVSTAGPTVSHTFDAIGCSVGTLRVVDDGGNFTEDAIFVRAEGAAVDPVDCDGDGLSDECDVDCNGNGISDRCDIANGTESDVDGDGVPDSCQGDCNLNGIPDVVEIDQGMEADCNLNGKPDACDITVGVSQDCNANGVPDECDPISDFLGDMDCSCVISVTDISPFVQAVTAPGAYVSEHPTCDILRADFNGDGSVTVSDIGGMVLRLTGN